MFRNLDTTPCVFQVDTPFPLLLSTLRARISLAMVEGCLPIFTAIILRDAPCLRACSISRRSVSVRCLFLAMMVPFVCAPRDCGMHDGTGYGANLAD